MAKLRRSQRIAVITHHLMERPGQLISLKEFEAMFGSAKSTLSEDLSIVKEVFGQYELGRIETTPGAGGGLRFLPGVAIGQAREAAEKLCQVISDADRILTGGFIYTTDIAFSPRWASRFGRIFAEMFRPLEPTHVITVETKGIPLALMTARYLGLPLVTIRKNTRVSEGTSVGINYMSGSSERIQTMSLPRQALGQESKVLFVDDFMRGGGTARGVIKLMKEFSTEVLGIATLIVTAKPEKKRVDRYRNLVVLEAIDPDDSMVSAHPAAWLTEAESVRVD